MVRRAGSERQVVGSQFDEKFRPPTVEELLEKQQLAVQQVMTFNKEIMQRLSHDRGTRQDEKHGSPTRCPSEQLATQPRPSSIQTEGSAAGLRQPLLDKPSQYSLDTQPESVLCSETLVRSVEDALDRNDESYTVESLYSTEGRWQALARSTCFQNVALIVIVLNSIWIAIDTDYRTTDMRSDENMNLQVIENIFCAFFTFEISVRFFAFKEKTLAFTDPWFVFDFILVAVNVFESWIVTPLRMMGSFSVIYDTTQLENSSIFRALHFFRVARVTRIVRVFRYFPEIWALVLGMATGMRSVIATFGLLMAQVYMYGIVLTELLKDSETSIDKDGHTLKDDFSGVAVSMNTLLMQGIFSDQAGFFADMLQEGLLYYTIFMLFMLTGAITVMGTLTGVLCDVMGDIDSEQKEEAASRQLRMQVDKLMTEIDENGDKKISKDEFATMLKNTDYMKTLHDINVDVMALARCGEYIFRNSTDLPIPAFTNAVLRFRSEKEASAIDLIELRHFISQELEDLKLRRSADVDRPTDKKAHREPRRHTVLSFYGGKDHLAPPLSNDHDDQKADHEERAPPQSNDHEDHKLDHEDWVLEHGVRVKVTTPANPFLNGKTGVCENYDDKAERWIVKMDHDGDMAGFKPETLAAPNPKEEWGPQPSTVMPDHQAPQDPNTPKEELRETRFLTVLPEHHDLQEVQRFSSASGGPLLPIGAGTDQSGRRKTSDSWLYGSDRPRRGSGASFTSPHHGDGSSSPTSPCDGRSSSPSLFATTMGRIEKEESFRKRLSSKSLDKSKPSSVGRAGT